MDLLTTHSVLNTLVNFAFTLLVYGADWSCTLAISTDLEARCYLDPGQAALRSYHKHHPNVHCPFTSVYMYVAYSHCCGVDGSCTLAISPDLEARCYLDAGQAALRTDHNDHPNVQCPITVGVGDSNQGPVSFLAAEGIKQARRFPQGRSERSFPFMLS